MDAHPTYALVIGACRYTAFDQSTGRPPGSSDLPGAASDAATWADLARRAGVPEQNLRVLCDGLSSEPGLAAPTGEAIREGVRWLAGNLASADAPVGMLVFAGHGDFREDGLVLAGVDTTGPALAEAVSFAELDQVLMETCPRGRLIAVLECCHAGDASGGARGRSLTGRPLPADLSRRRPLGPALVIGACEGEQSASEISVRGAWGGAFTRACDLVLATAGGSLTAGALSERTGSVLTAMGLPQRPVVLGRRGAEPFLAPLAGGEPSLRGEELSPGETESNFTLFALTVYLSESQHFGGGNLLVTGAHPPGGWAPNRAYWFYPKNNGQDVNPFTSPGAWCDLTPLFGVSIPNTLQPGGASQILSSNPFPAMALYKISARAQTNPLTDIVIGYLACGASSGSASPTQTWFVTDTTYVQDQTLSLPQASSGQPQLYLHIVPASGSSSPFTGSTLMETDTLQSP